MAVLPYIGMNQPWVYMCPTILNPPPPPSPSHSSGLSQSTSFGFPASCIEFALVIYFTCGNIHVSMLFSHIILPTSSPTVSKNFSLCLFLLCCLPHRIISTTFLDSICVCVLIYNICLFLTYFTLHNRHKVQPPH